MTVIYLEKRFLKIIMGSQISFTAVGDIFMNRMLPEAGYEGLSELSELISSSEVRFANLETTIHDREGYPFPFSGGTWAMAHPSVLDDLKKYNFNLYNAANNHSMDYSHNGLLATIRHMKERNVRFAGVGRNLADAAAPVYLECREARVALIAATSSFHVCSAAIGIIDGIVPPAKQFQDFGGTVGLGSDQANGNNEHNLFNEMRMTAMFNKIKYADPEVMPCWKVLRMATIEGAKAIGVDDVTGSIEKGKDADIILVRTDIPAMQPVYETPMRNLIPNIVYAATGRDVDTVISGGKIIVKDRKPVTFDLEEVIAEAQEAADKLVPAAEPVFWEINGVNAGYMREGKL